MVFRDHSMLLGVVVLAGLQASTVYAQSTCTRDDVWCAGDVDGDQVVDSVDACDDQPEDHDDHDDLDGCPDPDDDSDGIPDSDDECPDFPEDRDGVRDDDGCPDQDARHRPRRRSRRRSRSENDVPRPRAPQDWLTIALAFADTHRSLDVHVDPEPVARHYRSPGAGYLEAGIEVTAFLPFAPYLGIHVGLWQSVVIGTTGCTGTADRLSECPVAMQRDIATTARELVGSLVLRRRFGHARDAVTAMALVGFGQYAFTLDEAATATLNPEIAVETQRYTYVGLEARLDVPVPDTPLLGTASALYRIGLDDVGDAAKERFGNAASSGHHSGFGFRVGLRSELPFLTRGAFVATRFDWYHFDATFDGRGSAAEYGATSSDDVLRLGLVFGMALQD